MKPFLVVTAAFSLLLAACGGGAPKEVFVTTTPVAGRIAGTDSTLETRQAWLTALDKMASPVLTNLAAGTLKQKMTVQFGDSSVVNDFTKPSAYLEAFGRLSAGIAPWLSAEGGDANELALRQKYRDLFVKALSNAVNPQSPDYLNFKQGNQRLVDASYLAFALMRAPGIWQQLPEEVKKNVVTAFTDCRSVTPFNNNWILNSALIEAFFAKNGLPYDDVRIEYALRQMEQWYLGDGIYSDGKEFHWDMYNSVVIHPYLTAVLETILPIKVTAPGFKDKIKAIVKDVEPNPYAVMHEKLEKTNARYATILERLIAPDGSYPIIGRSVVYRGGAFHHLADMAWRKQLPDNLPAGQVRRALSAVLHRTLSAPGTYTADGWLEIGVDGHQPALANNYITTGSLYMSSLIFLPLGLPATDPFWSAPSSPITQEKIWGGVNAGQDQY